MTGTRCGVLGNDIELGEVTLHPQRRAIAGQAGTVSVEPLVMQLICTLAQEAGRMVDRAALFEACWNGTPVGDDSLNRLVAAARRGLRTAGGEAVVIETVPGRGYVLALRRHAFDNEAEADFAVSRAREAAFDSWRKAFPAPDHVAIEKLRLALASAPARADGWGMLALMQRHAAEYAATHERSEFLEACEASARQALALEPGQPEAEVALTGVVPLFGNWLWAHERLSAVRARAPDNAIAAHDLAIIEMASGRIEAAKALLDPLIAADPVAPCYAYKSAYHHWSLGDLATMDQRADRAIQLWPQHAAVWTARFWTLAHTGRIAAAAQMLTGEGARPPVPEPLANFLKDVLVACGGPEGQRADVARRAVAQVSAGPAQAVNSLMALGLLDDVERALAVAEAFYCRAGEVTVPMHGEAGSPVNEMGRRLTQVLFTPACQAMRDDPKFERLCERIGLAEYWQTSQRHPDFRHRECSD